jgi:hypothetical protein
MRQGYITLISVLIVGAVGASVAISSILLGLSSSQTSSVFQKSGLVEGVASACAEEALQQIRNSISYLGGGNLSFSQGSCSYSVASTGGENRVLTITGSMDNVVRKLRITINDINPKLQIESWKYVPDF